MSSKLSFNFSDENLATIFSDRDLAIRIDQIITKSSEEVLEKANIMKELLVNLPRISEEEKLLISASLSSSTDILISFEEVLKMLIISRSFKKIYETVDFNFKETMVQLLDNDSDELLINAIINVVCILTGKDYYDLLVAVFL